MFVEPAVAWDAVSALVAICALFVSVFVLRSQRGRDKQHTRIQERLAAIEEARRMDEVEARTEARQSALKADVRVTEFRMERPGLAGESDKLSITVENRGPAAASNLDVAMLESEDRASMNHLGDAVEWLEEFGGYSGTSRKGYFQIGWELPSPRPLVSLAPAAQVTFPFWLRVRVIGNTGFRLVWEDADGIHVSKIFVPFDDEPARRF